MKQLFFLLSSVALGLAALLILNPPDPNLVPSTGPDELDRFGNRVGRWGSRQRLTGAGSQLAGSVEQTAGDLIGNDRLASQGAFDQAKGAVKDAAGQVAHAVEDTLHDLNR